MSALTYATAQLLRVLPREKITRFAGALADHKWSAPLGRTVINIYSRAYNVELDDCIEKSGWPSFDAFFTRELREGARPVDRDPRTITSPADGAIGSMGPIEADSTFRVKGSDYRVEDLVGDAAEAKRYVGGSGCVVYLSPRDYHRVHAPAAGVVSTVRSMAGDYYPVNGIGLRHVKGLFVRNRRVAIAIDTPQDVGLGRVTVVMVAAIVVGRISVKGIDARDVPIGTLHPAVAVDRGGEIGIFHLGSTAVVLLEPGATGPWLVGDGPIKLGRAICRGPEGVG